MNANKKRIIAVICLLVFVVGVFVACKKEETEENLVSVSTDENGSLYYTDPTREADGITYGGETHFVKPEETNKNGEYKIGDVTSQSYTTDRDGNLAPVTTEPVTTAPNDTSTTSGGNNGGSSGTSTTSGGNNGGSSGTSTTSGGNNGGSSSSDQQSETQSTEETSYAGIDDVVDDNNLNNDGVIPAW